MVLGWVPAAINSVRAGISYSIPSVVVSRNALA
jgi:hypothetical protein